MLYVFVVIAHGTRRLVHVNVTAHPSAAWTLQQLREVVGGTEQHKFLIHDRGAIFAKGLDDSILALGLAVLRSPCRKPEGERDLRARDWHHPPRVPGPPLSSARVPESESRHRLAAGALVLAKSVLGGLHHEYSTATTPAIARSSRCQVAQRIPQGVEAEYMVRAVSCAGRHFCGAQRALTAN